MGTRSWATCAVFLFAISSAAADPKADIAAKTKEAMENYDLMDYDAAKKLLNQALTIAKKAKLEKDSLVATVYLDLGIAAFAAGDPDGARVAFLTAVQIDPKIQISAAYKSPELQKLLDEARGDGGGGSSDTPPVTDASVDCTTVKGLQHTILDSAPAGVPASIEALIGSDITPVKVAVLYRVEGATDFTEVKLSKQGDCKYTGAIPAAAMHGALLHYYVGAFDGNNKVIAAKGSSGSPNILELTGKATGPTRPDEEDPINGKGGTSGGSVSGGVLAGGKPPKVMVTIAGGTGTGYLSGDTEGGNVVDSKGIKNWGPSPVVLTPEISYAVNPKLMVGVAVRIGFPIGANVNAEGAEGHSTIAPAGLVRVRYAFSASGEGVRVMGQAGGGVMRSTINLPAAPPGMNTDIVAQGPILFGAGIGYLKRLTSSVSFVADGSVLVGIASGDTFQGIAVNSGFGADLSLGLAFGF